MNIAANNLPASAQSEVAKFYAELAKRHDLKFIVKGSGESTVYDFAPIPRASPNVVTLPVRRRTEPGFPNSPQAA